MTNLLYGLSPRVRGNRSRATSRCAHSRSIPACAGEPIAPDASVVISTVYPRVCGGTVHIRRGSAYPEGLSPRVRGNPVTVPVDAERIGSIPACAGEPYLLVELKSQRGVYPRVCGGTGGGDDCRRGQGGLSPRVRGNRILRSALQCW